MRKLLLSALIFPLFVISAPVQSYFQKYANPEYPLKLGTS
jgi:hypothetical protein